MAEKRWDEKIMELLKTTGDGIRNETERLMNEMSDPANQDKVRQRLREVGEWAKKTAEDAAVMVEQAAEKVEAAITKASTSKPEGEKTSASRPTKPTSKRAGKSLKRKVRKKA